MVDLAEGLTANSALEILLLADNPFGDEGGMKMAEVLCCENSCLRVLDVHGTHMSRHVERRVSSPFQQSTVPYFAPCVLRSLLLPRQLMQ